MPVIARLWHGWTALEDARAYEELLRNDVLPGIHSVHGHRGAFLLRRELAEGIEFAVLTMFDSWDAVRAFAGDDFEAAVIHESARRLLSRFDERSVHYETLLAPTPDELLGRGRTSPAFDRDEGEVPA
jgi:heme-degrading monooxygenase HmoA